MRFRAAAFIVGLALAASGCSVFGAGLGESCVETSDCALTLVCEVGTCVDPLAGECIASGSETVCVDNAECCSQVCLSIDDRCKAQCDEDADCETGCCGPLAQGVFACLPESECF